MNWKSKFVAGIVMCAPVCALAQNPIVQTQLTGDPAPMVAGDRMYIYAGHDEDGADFFWMNEWRVYSSSDMVNWTDHGAPLNLSSFSWADGRAWASQTIERNGKYYWYVCAHSKLSGGMAIGVAVGDTPTGPFKDAIGKPLFDNGKWDNIDPTVFIDTDGQAYLYWGNPRLYYARLNEDMISLKGGVKDKEKVDDKGEVGMITQTVEGFGAPDIEKRDSTVKYRDNYTEGPWLMKRDKNYYLLYAAGGVPEHIAYSMSKKPLGPWKYVGEIMPLENTGSFTNHCGVVDFKGKSYFVYHTGKLGGGFGRSVAVEEFKFNDDGTFPIIHHTREGVKPVGTLDPYQRTEAETIADSKGVKSEWNDETGVYISEINTGDFIKVREVDFGAAGPRQFTAAVASALQGGTVEVRADALDGTLVASLAVPHTGGWEKWQTLTATVASPVTGKHDLYFVFKGNKGGKLFTFDWWQFAK
jgi:beta-xylosidase